MMTIPEAPSGPVEMADCDQDAVVVAGTDAYACPSHRWELAAAAGDEGIVLHYATPGHTCGEHLRDEVTGHE